MDTEKKFEQVKQYVHDELELSDQMVSYYRLKGDKDRMRSWMNRYDILYGVWLRIID